jgi:Glycosyl transferase family 2
MPDRDLGVVIAIPTHNRADLLARAARSALAQDHTHITLIISDDGSTDDTRITCHELASGDPRVVVHRQGANLGLTGNYNWLVKRAVTDRKATDGYFMFLSDDDWLEPDYVSSCVQAFESRRDHSMVAGRTVLELDSAVPQVEADVNLVSDSAAARLWTFCQDVLPTGVFSGLMPFEVVRQLPPQRNVLGHDWILLANIAVLGKIATVAETAIHRDTNGASTSLKALANTLGVSPLQAVRPLLNIGYFMAAECLRRSPVMGRLPLASRIHLACVVLVGLFSRKAVPRLQRAADHSSARAALYGLGKLRRSILRMEPRRHDKRSRPTRDPRLSVPLEHADRSASATGPRYPRD